jgi:predicted enzyme related to lactoylglutathione lyase
MQSKPVGWFEIYVQDMKRAKAFYEAVFAVQLEKLESPPIRTWKCGLFRALWIRAMELLVPW